MSEPRGLPPLPPIWLGKLRRHINRQVSYAHAYKPGRCCDGRHELIMITGIEDLIKRYGGNTEPALIWRQVYALVASQDCGQICPTLDYIETLVEQYQSTAT